MLELSSHCLTLINYLDREKIPECAAMDSYIEKSIYAVAKGNRSPNNKNAHQPISIGGSLLEAANKTRHSHYFINGERISYRWELELEHLLDQTESRYLFREGMYWPGNRLNYHVTSYKTKASITAKKVTRAITCHISRDPDEDAEFSIVKAEHIVKVPNKAKGRLKYKDFVKRISKRIKRNKRQ